MSLLAISALSTWLALVVFRRFTNSVALRRATNLIIAHLLECVLFLDEPQLVLRAQGELIRADLLFLRLIIVPVVLLVVPFWFLLTQLEANFGRAPLPLGVPSVLTLHDDNETRPPDLAAPAEIAIETPAVRNVFANEVNWRIRPLKPTSGPVRITMSGHVRIASVRAGHRVVATIVNPFAKAVIDPHYPTATVLHHSWFTWYIAACVFTGLLWWVCHT